MIWRILGAGVFTAGLAAGAAIPRGPASTHAATPGPVDLVSESQAADQRTPLEAILAGMRGADPVVCELALLAVGGRSFGWSSVRADVEETLMDSMTGRELTEWIMGPSHDEDRVPPLRRALADDDVCVRRTAARLLGRNRSESAVEALMDGLRSPDPGIRRASAVGLGIAERPATAPALRSALDDDNAGVRAAAAWALGEIEDREAVAPLIHALEGDGDHIVRKTAAWALGRID